MAFVGFLLEENKIHRLTFIVGSPGLHLSPEGCSRPGHMPPDEGHEGAPDTARPGAGAALERLHPGSPWFPQSARLPGHQGR